MAASQKVARGITLTFCHARDLPSENDVCGRQVRAPRRKPRPPCTGPPVWLHVRLCAAFVAGWDHSSPCRCWRRCRRVGAACWAHAAGAWPVRPPVTHRLTSRWWPSGWRRARRYQRGRSDRSSGRGARRSGRRGDGAALEPCGARLTRLQPKPPVAHTKGHQQFGGQSLPGRRI